MDPSIMKLLEEDEDETMHSGADVEAFTAALNRDIEGDTSTSQPTDSDGAALSQGSYHTSGQLFPPWHSSSQNDKANSQSQQNLDGSRQQDPHSSEMELKQYGSGPENQRQQIDHQLLDDHRQRQGEQNTLHFSRPPGMQNSEKNSELPKINQHAVATEQAMKPGNRQVPFGLLLPLLIPQLDKDRAVQLQTIFNKLKKNEISKDIFVHNMRNIVGDQMLKIAVYKLHAQGKQAARNSQTGPNQLSSQSQASAQKQHQKMPTVGPHQGNVPQSFAQLHQKGGTGDASHIPSPASQLKSDSGNVTLGKKPSFPIYGSAGNSYHPFSGSNVSASGSSLKQQPHDSQMRQGSVLQSVDANQVPNNGGASVQGFRKGGQMGRIFGDVGGGLDIPLDDLGDVGILSEGASGGGFTSNPSRRHGIGKQLRNISVPSSTELLMDHEDEESLEDDDSADNGSMESDGSEMESEVGERMECVAGKSGNNELERAVGVVLASKEIVRPEDIDSSSSQVDGGESAPLAGTSVAQPSKDLDSAAPMTVKVPFGFAAFGTASAVGVRVAGGTASAVGVRVAGDLVSSALGGGRGGLASSCGSMSEVVTDSPMGEMDGEYIVIRRNDGSVELKGGGVSVVVKLEYFDDVKDSYREWVLYVFRLHPSTFVGLGALSPMERKFVLLEFGVYLECLDGLMLPAARVEDFALLHKKLTSLKNNGLEVQWLFDRNDRLAAQLEVAQWSDKAEQLEASLGTAMGTVAHLEERLEKAKGEVAQLEENLGEARVVVVHLKEEKANCVEKQKAASKFATLDFDFRGSASQGLLG